MGIELKNKGQMFLITSVIIVVILIILKASVNLPSIIEEKKQLESRFEDEFFTNIANCLLEVTEISYHQPENITRNIFDFANFTRKTMNERLLTFNFLYVDTITSYSSSKMNVTVVNLLNKPINISLSLNDSQSDSMNNINDSTSWNANFNINPGSNYILTIFYNNQFEENLTILTKITKNTYSGFFDITLTGSEATYKDKFQKSYTLP